MSSLVSIKRCSVKMDPSHVLLYLHIQTKTEDDMKVDALSYS